MLLDKLFSGGGGGIGGLFKNLLDPLGLFSKQEDPEAKRLRKQDDRTYELQRSALDQHYALENRKVTLAADVAKSRLF